MSKSGEKYLVGIDLGTTHTVLAYGKLTAKRQVPKIELFQIEQLVGPGQVAAQALLPSVRYHPAQGELSEAALQLPWPDPEPGVVTGQWARQLAAQVPGRLVASAKSWLSHPGVDRLAPILPWGANPEQIQKISPVAASSSYLRHVRHAWDLRFPKQPLAQQELVLTIPASFDEAARALTLQAAHEAGLPNLRLLEEPQAAFYDWLFRHRQHLKTELAASRRVLVVDVGGGTTDFSLIDIAIEAGEPQLTRIGVGNHLMLGGDNMDLALAHLAETRLASNGKLSSGQMSQLIERCRHAKEQLLAPDAPEQATLTLLGSGSKLIGGARSTVLGREEVGQMMLDGFFPHGLLAEGAKKSRSGLLEFGLPYASDPAITRHLASFLQQYQDALPDTLLLNGGVFHAVPLAERLQQVLDQWGAQPVRLLHNDSPDLAVARGAVAYALARHGLGPRIGGGAARSYYLRLDEKRNNEQRGQSTASAARAVCILPRGSEPGHEIALAERQFALRLGQPVQFHLLSSTGTARHVAGEIVPCNDDDWITLPPIVAVLPAGPVKKQDVPVQLATMLTEVGTLEVHCVAQAGASAPKRASAGVDTGSGAGSGTDANAGVETGAGADAPQRWRLEFQLRTEPDDTPRLDDSAALPARLPEALAQIERIFGKSGAQLAPKEIKGLRAQLEQLLGPRERWNTPLLRQLFDALWQRAKSRRRSVEHERLWFNLAGFCLRPGFGYPLDEWRMEQLWPLFELGVQFGKDSQVCSEWWTLWRRVASGLPLAAQLRLLDDFALNLQGSAEDLRQRPANSVAGNLDDMLRLGAALERIPAAYKAEIGEWLFKQIKPEQEPERNARHLWAIASIGARAPFYAASHEVVDADTVQRWLEQLTRFDWRRNEAAAFAATHLARKTGDRARDLPDEVCATLAQRLRAANAPALWQDLVTQVMQLDEEGQRRVLGEALPPGLKLLG
jgi:hypothetical protein